MLSSAGLLRHKYTWILIGYEALVPGRPTRAPIRTLCSKRFTSSRMPCVAPYLAGYLNGRNRELCLPELSELEANGTLDRVRRTVVLACGTSAVAAHVGKYFIEQWA